MNSTITTLKPPTPTVHTKTILSKDDFNCSIVMLAPGDELPVRESSYVDNQIVFIVEGEATVRSGDVNTILNKDEAMLIPKGEEHVIVAHPDERTKLLVVKVPPRQVITPPLVSLER